MKKLKIFETFAGYGGGSFALKKAGIPFECVGYSEISPLPIKCYDKNHLNIKNYGDISKIDFKDIPDFDLLTGGFPCQDVSFNGKQDLKKGRTVLVFNLIDCLKVKKPKYFLFENVSGIYSNKFKDFLRDVVLQFADCGYNVYHTMLNSSQFGVKQNRDRVWFVGIRKDIQFKFRFPEPTHPKINLITVDGKNGMCKNKKQQLDRVYLLSSGISCLTHSFSKRMVFDGEKTRELTKEEYCKFMGFEDGEIDVSDLSTNQVSSLMGNGWDVNLVSKIFKNLLENWENHTQANPTDLSFNKDLTEFNKLNSQMTLQVTSLNPDIKCNMNKSLHSRVQQER